MECLNDDALYHIFKFLPLKDSYYFALTSKYNFEILANDYLWKIWTKRTFGEVTLEDVKKEDACWKDVYETYCKLYIEAVKHLKKKYNKRSTIRKLEFETFESFLYRDASKAMIIPYLKKPFLINPRNGDVIIDVERVGYRNEGITFWDDDPIKRGGCYYSIDEYGSVPLRYSWPTFPVTYYIGIIQHNNLVNFTCDIKDMEIDLDARTIKLKGPSETILLYLGDMFIPGIIAHHEFSVNKRFTLSFEKYENNTFFMN